MHYIVFCFEKKAHSKKMIIMNISIHFFILFISYKVTNAGGGVDYSVDKNAIILPMEKLKRNLEFIKEDCGEVCDTSDNFVKKPGLYFDKIVKNIECDYLFESPLIDSSNADMAEQYWHRTKEEYHNKDNAAPKMDMGKNRDIYDKEYRTGKFKVHNVKMQLISEFFLFNFLLLKFLI